MNYSTLMWMTVFAAAASVAVDTNVKLGDELDETVARFEELDVRLDAIEERVDPFLGVYDQVFMPQSEVE